MKIISLGAGVQSSVLFLKSCLGEIDKADAAIFADTQGEPEEVYEYLEYLIEIGNKYGIPVYKVSKGDLLQDFLDAKDGKRKRASSIPFHLKENGIKIGLLGRQCTLDYKIMPVRAKVKEIMKSAGLKSVDMLIGISLDEIQRVKPSRVKFITHNYPLIDAGLTRQDCLFWIDKNGFKKPPRSACYYCPFHDNREWRRIKNEMPELWEEAKRLDKYIRHIPGVRADAYLHKSAYPLEEADLEEELNQLDLFNNECEGMCGV